MTPVVFVYFAHHLPRDSGTVRCIRDILWTIDALEMMAITTMVVLDAAHCEVRIYSRVRDLCMYPFRMTCPVAGSVGFSPYSRRFWGL